MKRLRLFFAALMILQVICLIIMSCQDHVINWAACIVIFPALAGYMMLRLWMADNKPAVK